MSELTSLKKQRSTIKAKLTNISKFINANPADIDIEAIRTRVARVDMLMNEFTTIESKIFNVDPEEEPDFEFEEKYYDAKTKLNSKLRKLTMIPGGDMQGMDITLNHSHTGQAEVKLPKLSIPPFSGEYTEWQSFYDLFSSTIHDSTILSPVQKFQYLKGSLRGEAAALLRHISVTEANYMEALHKLKDRYDRKKHIINSFIRTFVDHPPIQIANANKIKNLLDTADEVVRGLKSLGPTAESRDPWLIYWLVSKLDDKSKCMWAETSAEMEQPKLEEFFKFLQIRIDSLESLSSSVKLRNPKGPIKGHVVASESTVFECSFCNNKTHSLFDCHQFNNLDVNQRKEWVKNNRRCFNCLSRRHAIFNCQSRRRCRTCSGKHNTLLHVNVAETKGMPESCESSSKQDDSTTSLSSTVVQSNCGKVLKLHSILPTAQIIVLDCYGKPQKCRALLDSGSQASFITESCIQRLNLKRSNSRISVSGLGLTKAGLTRGKVTLVVQPPDQPEFEINALVLSNITSWLPSQTISGISVNMWDSLQLADRNFNKPSAIDILIGADHFFAILLNGRKQLGEHGLIIQNSIFGWVVSGTTEEDQETMTSMLVTNYLDPDVNIDNSLKRFWEIESVGDEKTILSAEEKMCEQHFKENVSRNLNGRFVVSLPFKESPDELSNTMSMAIQRLRSMERRFERDNDFKNLYCEFMTEYEELKHMEKIPENEIKADGYYLPHHGVLRTASSTTKLRVVFDGSAKSNAGHSLNNYLAVGPTIQSNLFSIIFRFREHKIAISADIEKMYRQVLIDPKHRKFQQIVWRKNSSDPICHYRLSTVTYGLSSAPFLAIRCLKQIGEEQKHSSPIACHAIEKSIYVDDLMASVDTEQDGLQLKYDISNILRQYGFQLRKWSSNYPKLLNSTSSNEDVNKIKELDDAAIESSPYVKVLGVSWHPREDRFIFKTSIRNHSNFTKRVILSEASRLFDPLGWLTPVVVQVKIFMQKLWILNLNWDDALPEEQKQQWDKIRCNLKEAEHLTLPRFIQSSNHSTVDIHGFCDASESAYAAAIYFKITTPGKGVFVHLVTAKSKVAPIKQVSLPRLELCGAVLLVKLIETVKRETSLKINNILAWTDSKIVLDWLANEPRRWVTFVANRTSLIMDIVPRSHWRHIPSLHNPADCASRGMPPSKLREHNLWWKGPDWLTQPEECWPAQQTNYGCKQEERSIKLNVLGGFLCNELLDSMLLKYSSVYKLQRILSIVIRFMKNTQMKLKEERSIGKFLKPQELFTAFRILCEYEQKRAYYDEISALERNAKINKSSSLISLNPFMDKDNLLRVGGRIENSAAPYNTKHPLILPPKSIFTRLILEDLHKKHHHAGPSLLLSVFRQSYWSTSGRNVVREIIRKCVICRRCQATSQHQLMGNLPDSRVELVRPFYKTGVDFAGPMLIHLTKGRGQRTYKAYIGVFVCLSIKAVHLELVGDLSSESFTAALKRFVARRGVPIEIQSDNGTNFVGASKVIQEEVEKIKNSTNLSYFLSSNSISWRFIPPSAPHFGGIWEAAVKSAKFHLKRVIGKTILTLEEMTTLLAEIESCLNSRPICVLSADHIDALTPAHFLVGHPLTKIPEADVTEYKASHLTRWKTVQQLHQQFWKRWQREYLPSLQQRTKWRYPQTQIKINDVVIIKDNMPPNQWLLGKVIHIHPGTDGLVRVVTLKTKSGQLKRPIHKLCILPVDCNMNETSTLEDSPPEKK